MVRFCVRYALAVFVATAAAPLAHAACEDPKWDLARIATLFQATAPETAVDSLSRAALGALIVALTHIGSAKLDLPPERPPKNPDSFAAALHFTAGDAGIFRVALSDAAWIDVIQDGKFLTPDDFAGFHDCPGVRKIVLFEIGPEPFALQLSDATAPSISVAIVPAR